MYKKPLTNKSITKLLILSGVLVASGVFTAYSSAKVIGKKPSLEKVKITCIKKGPLKGRVAVDETVRYALPAHGKVNFQTMRHVVGVKIELKKQSGATLASTQVKETRREASRTLKHVNHVHRAILSKAASRKVMRYARGTADCTGRAKTHKRVKVKSIQTQSLRGQKPQANASAAKANSSIPAARAAQVNQSVTSADQTSAPVVASSAVPPVIGGCQIEQDAYCQGADLMNANLAGQDMTNIDLSQANLSGADLTNAVLDFADLVQVSLSEAIVGGLSAQNANLFGARLVSATQTGGSQTPTQATNFSNSNLGYSDFTRADMTGVNLTMANLQGVLFSYTILNGANFTEANLPRAIMTGAKCDSTTVYQNSTTGHGSTCPRSPY